MQSRLLSNPIRLFGFIRPVVDPKDKTASPFSLNDPASVGGTPVRDLVATSKRTRNSGVFQRDIQHFLNLALCQTLSHLIHVLWRSQHNCSKDDPKPPWFAYRTTLGRPTEARYVEANSPVTPNDIRMPAADALRYMGGCRCRSGWSRWVAQASASNQRPVSRCLGSKSVPSKAHARV